MKLRIGKENIARSANWFHNGGNVGGQANSQRDEGRDGGSSGRERRRWAESEVGETDDAPST